MWTNLVFSTVSIYTVLNTPQATEIFTQVISTSLNGIASSLKLMAYYNSNQTIKTYMEELELMDIEIKLKVIDRWLKSIDHNDIEPNSSLDIVYKGLAETCHQLSNLIYIINHKITYHNNLWFSRWRSINIEDEIKKIGRLSKILSDRIILINIIGNKNSIEKKSYEIKKNDCSYMNLTNKESSNIQFNNIDKVMPMHIISEPYIMKSDKLDYSTMVNNEPSRMLLNNLDKAQIVNEPYLMKSDKLNYSTMLNNEPGETRLNDFTII
jgi:hypothetical protein